MQCKGTYSPQLLMIHSAVYWHERLHSDKDFSKMTLYYKRVRGKIIQ